MSLDRRITAILARLAGASGGEAVAALAALRRLLPKGTDLADVITVGLHHMRQDIRDPSLPAELRRLTDEAHQAARQAEALRTRVRVLEGALAAALEDLEAARRQMAAEPDGASGRAQDSRSE